MLLNLSDIIMLRRFLYWYEKHTTQSLAITALILFMQIPHMVWAGDAILQTGVVWGANPILDFFLYGIDLVEIIPMISVTLAIVSKVYVKKV